MPRQTLNELFSGTPAAPQHQLGFWESMPERRKKKDEADWGLDNAEKACKPKACDIQLCLSRKGYQEKACAFEIEAYHDCVKRHRALRAGEIGDERSAESIDYSSKRQ